MKNSPNLRRTALGGMDKASSDPWLTELEIAFQKPHPTILETYEEVASKYDHYRELWLKVAGGDTEEVFLEALWENLKPGGLILDAGCGTGAISRRIHERVPSATLTMLDFSSKMLDLARDVQGDHIIGDVENLPFPDNSFDIVVSAWVIETVPHPKRAVSEFLRVIKDDGFVFYTFCSLPEGWVSRAGSALLRKAVERGFGGKFLKPEESPWHDCDKSRRVRFHGGLSTFITLRKCCHVEAEILPGRLGANDE